MFVDDTKTLNYGVSMPRKMKNAYMYPVARAALIHLLGSTPKNFCTAPSRCGEQTCCSSYSQSHEDLAIYEQFFADATLTREHVFVEMGALDGIALSNTLAFKRSNLSWTGVLIEANPRFCEPLWSGWTRRNHYVQRRHKGLLERRLRAGEVLIHLRGGGRQWASNRVRVRRLHAENLGPGQVRRLRDWRPGGDAHRPRQPLLRPLRSRDRLCSGAGRGRR